MLFFAPTVQADTLYQVLIEESLRGVCYGYPMNLGSFDDKSSCEHEVQRLTQSHEEGAAIAFPDRAATGEYQRHENNGQVVEKKYFCFKNDEDFNRRLGRSLCEDTETREIIEPISDI